MSAVWAGFFVASLPMIARMMRHFFCSTEWARKQGISSDKLRLFSFRWKPSEARAPGLLVLVILLLALLMLEFWGGVPGIFSGNRDALQALSYSEPHLARVRRSGAREGWERREPADVLKGRSSSTAVWTGKEMIVFGGEGLQVTFGDGARYNFEQNAWTRLPLEGAAPSRRTCASAVWTGSAMIIWGGFGEGDGGVVNRRDGALFDPANNVWRQVSTRGAPSARFFHTGLWTGEEMLIWGGFSESRMRLDQRQGDAFLNTGGCYDPATDTWREITITGAPSKRIHPAAVWTGREMIIWGGGNSAGDLNDGARYDPTADSWRPMRSEGAPSPRIDRDGRCA